MVSHRTTRVLPFSQEQVFGLVADVESYPQFLPMWQGARIWRIPGNAEHIYRTEQSIQMGPVTKRFITDTRMRHPDQIDVTSNDALFRRFLISWRFEALQEERCRIDFSMDCAARSLLLQPVMEVVLTETAQIIVTAFERRAHRLFG
jgi:coenzyme Q-binding protein COQ10